jgi:hypothetical protein
MAPLAGVAGSYNHHLSDEVTKSQSKKPILKKVIVSLPNKNSSELRRGWDDHTSLYDLPARTSMSRSVWDANLPGSTWDPSTFGTSSIGTNRSGHRSGRGFVHPFQQHQIPRTNTPPLTYANSFTLFEPDTNNARHYLPTIITEDDDGDLDITDSTTLSTSMSSQRHRPQLSNSHSTPSLRRPSLTSQRTPSLTDKNKDDANNDPHLCVNMTPLSRSHHSASSRLIHGSFNTSHSKWDLQMNGASSTDSPRASLALGIPITSNAPMTLRTTIKRAFRIRFRSKVDSGVSREDIREARREFEENERLKQEKYESNQRKKRERKDSKIERAASRRATVASDMASIWRPSFLWKRTSNCGWLCLC